MYIWGDQLPGTKLPTTLSGVCRVPRTLASARQKRALHDMRCHKSEMLSHAGHVSQHIAFMAGLLLGSAHSSFAGASAIVAQGW